MKYQNIQKQQQWEQSKILELKSQVEQLKKQVSDMKEKERVCVTLLDEAVAKEMSVTNELQESQHVYRETKEKLDETEVRVAEQELEIQHQHKLAQKNQSKYLHLEQHSMNLQEELQTWSHKCREVMAENRQEKQKYAQLFDQHTKMDNQLEALRSQIRMMELKGQQVSDKLLECQDHPHRAAMEAMTLRTEFQLKHAQMERQLNQTEKRRCQVEIERDEALDEVMFIKSQCRMFQEESIQAQEQCAALEEKLVKFGEEKCKLVERFSTTMRKMPSYKQELQEQRQDLGKLRQEKLDVLVDFQRVVKERNHAQQRLHHVLDRYQDFRSIIKQFHMEWAGWKGQYLEMVQCVRAFQVDIKNDLSVFQHRLLKSIAHWIKMRTLVSDTSNPAYSNATIDSTARAKRQSIQDTLLSQVEYLRSHCLKLRQESMTQFKSCNNQLQESFRSTLTQISDMHFATNRDLTCTPPTANTVPKKDGDSGGIVRSGEEKFQPGKQDFVFSSVSSSSSLLNQIDESLIQLERTFGTSSHGRVMNTDQTNQENEFEMSPIVQLSMNINDRIQYLLQLIQSKENTISEENRPSDVHSSSLEELNQCHDSEIIDIKDDVRHDHDQAQHDHRNRQSLPMDSKNHPLESKQHLSASSLSNSTESMTSPTKMKSSSPLPPHRQNQEARPKLNEQKSEGNVLHYPSTITSSSSSSIHNINEETAIIEEGAHDDPKNITTATGSTNQVSPAATFVASASPKMERSQDKSPSATENASTRDEGQKTSLETFLQALESEDRQVIPLQQQVNPKLWMKAMDAVAKGVLTEDEAKHVLTLSTHTPNHQFSTHLRPAEPRDEVEALWHHTDSHHQEKQNIHTIRQHQQQSHEQRFVGLVDTVTALIAKSNDMMSMGTTTTIEKNDPNGAFHSHVNSVVTNPRALSWVVKYIDKLLDENFWEEAKNYRDGILPLQFPEFVLQWLMRHYGLRTIVTQHCATFYHTIQYYRGDSVQIDTFGCFLDEVYDRFDRSFYLYVRDVALQTTPHQTYVRTHLNPTSPGAGARELETRCSLLQSWQLIQNVFGSQVPVHAFALYQGFITTFLRPVFLKIQHEMNDQEKTSSQEKERTTSGVEMDDPGPPDSATHSAQHSANQRKHRYRQELKLNQVVFTPDHPANVTPDEHKDDEAATTSEQKKECLQQLITFQQQSFEPLCREIENWTYASDILEVLTKARRDTIFQSFATQLEKFHHLLLRWWDETHENENSSTMTVEWYMLLYFCLIQYREERKRFRWLLENRIFQPYVHDAIPYPLYEKKLQHLVSWSSGTLKLLFASALDCPTNLERLGSSPGIDGLKPYDSLIPITLTFYATVFPQQRFQPRSRDTSSSGPTSLLYPSSSGGQRKKNRLEQQQRKIVYHTNASQPVTSSNTPKGGLTRAQDEITRTIHHQHQHPKVTSRKDAYSDAAFL